MYNQRVTNSPTAVQLMVTRQCNLYCTYCSAYRFECEELEPELDTGEWLELLKRLKEIQVFRVNFTGGEPFLRADIFEILETAAKYKFPKISVTSNATLIDEEIARSLEELNLPEFAVSLDGNREYHELLRGKGSFDRAISGVSHLINHGILPKILFSPLRSNFMHIEKLVAILYPMGIKKLSFNKIHPTGRCREIYNNILLDCMVDATEFNKIVERIRAEYEDFTIDDPPLTYQCFPQIHRQEQEKSGGPKEKKQILKPCSAGHSSCNITAGGWVLPCSELFDFKGGNIREQDILEIWRHSDNFSKIRALSNITSDQIPYCRNCRYNVYCDAGCRADAYEIYGDLTAPDPFCPYWKNK